MRDTQRIIKVLGYLAALYPRFELTDATITVYRDMLQDIEPELLHAAVKKIGGSSKWFPTVAEIRTAAKEIQNRALGIPTAAEAWGEVKRQIAAIGYYGSPEFQDAATAATVQAIGWRYLCTSTDEMVDRAHFTKYFGQIQGRREEERTALPMVNDAIKQLAEQMRSTKQLAQKDDKGR
jgi:hypothetical protein